MSTTPATLTVRCSSLPRLALCSAPLGARMAQPIIVSDAAAKQLNQTLGVVAEDRGALQAGMMVPVLLPTVIDIDPLNDASTIGVVVHDVLATLVTRQNSARHGELGDISDAARWHGLSDELVEEAAIMAHVGAQAWRELADAFPGAESEVDISWDFDEDDIGIKLTGKVDVLAMVDGEVRIIDFKSGRVERDHFHQMAGYAYLACRRTGYELASATLVNLRTKTTETFKWTIEELEKWFSSVVLGQIARYRDRYSPGAHCEFCPIRHSCEGRKAIVRSALEELTGVPASKADVLLGELNNPAQRGIVGGEVASLFERLGMIEQAIEGFRQHVKENVKQLGPLDVGGGRVLKIIESNRDKLDPVKSWPVVCEVLTEAEIAPAITLSKTKILDAVGAKVEKGKGKAKEAMMEQLKAAGAVSVTTSESLKIVKKES